MKYFEVARRPVSVRKKNQNPSTLTLHALTCIISIADDYLIKCISIFSRIIDGAVVDTKPTMAPSRCEHQDCDWSHDDTDIKVFIELLKFHCDARHPKNVAVDKTKPEKASDKTEAALKDEELVRWQGQEPRLSQWLHRQVRSHRRLLHRGSHQRPGHLRLGRHGDPEGCAEDADKITLEKLLSLVEGKMSSQTSQGLMSAEGGLTACVDLKPMKCCWCGEMHPHGKVNCKMISLYYYIRSLHSSA